MKPFFEHLTENLEDSKMISYFQQEDYFEKKMVEMTFVFSNGKTKPIQTLRLYEKRKSIDYICISNGRYILK